MALQLIPGSDRCYAFPESDGKFILPKKVIYIRPRRSARGTRQRHIAVHVRTGMMVKDLKKALIKVLEPSLPSGGQVDQFRLVTAYTRSRDIVAGAPIDNEATVGDAVPYDDPVLRIEKRRMKGGGKGRAGAKKKAMKK